MEHEQVYMVILIPILMLVFIELILFVFYLKDKYPKTMKWLQCETMFTNKYIPGRPYNPYRDLKLMFQNKTGFIDSNAKEDFIEEYNQLIKDKRYYTRKYFLIIYLIICIIYLFLFWKSF